MSNTLYRRHDVIRRLSSGELVVYRCLEIVPAGGFVVQSADRVRAAVSLSQCAAHEQQFWELLCEEAPEARSSAHPSLGEAIVAFDEEFGDKW